MKLYKHPKMNDVAMAVTRNFTRPHEEIRYLNVRWFNISNPNNIFDMHVKEHLVLTQDKFNEFEEYKC